MGVQTLTQGRTRRNSPQAKSAHEEGVTPKVLDGIEVVFAQTQQGQVALQNVAVGNPRASRKSCVNQRIDIDALEIIANECQTGVGTEVVGQLLDNEVGHVLVHLQGERYMGPKSLISIEKLTVFTTK